MLAPPAKAAITPFKSLFFAAVMSCFYDDDKDDDEDKNKDYKKQ